MALRDRFAAWRALFVGLVYADHNRSPVVRRVLAQRLDELSPSGFGLNVGAGGTRLDPRVRDLDIVDGPGIDYVGRAESIPLGNNTVDLVITQETLEHVADPVAAMAEITRVLGQAGPCTCRCRSRSATTPGRRTSGASRRRGSWPSLSRAA